MNIYRGIIPPPQPKNVDVGIDVELFKANKHKLHLPTTGEFACCSFYVPDGVYVVTDTKDIPESLHNVRDGVWIFHNAKFDLTHLRRWANIRPRKKIWDTMLFEQIIWSGYYERFALKHLVRRYLNIYLDKEARDQFETATELTSELVEYSAKDPYYTVLAKKAQMNHITKTEMMIWKEIERPYMWALLASQPIRIDRDKWVEVYKKNVKHVEEIENSLDFNPGSWQQIKDKLIPLGFKGLPDTQAKTLIKFINKYPDCEATPIAKQILTYKKYAKRASTYGENWISKYAEQTYRGWYIKPNWHQIGTETGGTSSSNPAIQTVPARDTLEFRECFIASEGNKLIIADYSQQEPRITAYVAKDKNMVKAFMAGDDLYCSIAQYLYGERIEKTDPRRKKTKATLLGIDYGMSAWRLAKEYDLPVDEAKEAINLVLNKFPGLKRYVQGQKKQKKYVTSVLGRKIWLNPYNYQLYTNSLNAPIQSTARGDMKKKAVVKLYHGWDYSGIPFPFVLDMHDEIVLDCPEDIAEEVSERLVHAMISVAEEMCPGVPFAVDVKIADNWAEGKLEE